MLKGGRIQINSERNHDARDSITPINITANANQNRSVRTLRRPTDLHNVTGRQSGGIRSGNVGEYQNPSEQDSGNRSVEGNPEIIEEGHEDESEAV